MYNIKIDLLVSDDEKIEFNEVFNPKLLEEIDLLPNELTANELSFEIIDNNGDYDVLNPNNLLSKIKNNTEIEVFYIDEMSTYYFGKFYLVSFERRGNTVSFKAQDIMKKLEEEEIDIGYVYNMSVGTFLDILLGKDNYDVYSETILEKKIIGQFIKSSKKEALLKMLLFTRLLCDTSRRRNPFFFLGMERGAIQKNVNSFEISNLIMDSDSVEIQEKYNTLTYSQGEILQDNTEDDVIYSEYLQKGEYTIYFEGYYNISSVENCKINDELGTIIDNYTSENYMRRRLSSVNIVVETDGDVKIYGKKKEYTSVVKTIDSTYINNGENLDISSVVFLSSAFQEVFHTYDQNLEKILDYFYFNNLKFEFDYDITKILEGNIVSLTDHCKILTNYYIGLEYYEYTKVWELYRGAIYGTINKLDIDLNSMLATIGTFGSNDNSINPENTRARIGTISQNEVENFDYTFKLNSDKYYEAENNEINNSVAIIKLVFSLDYDMTINFECINLSNDGNIVLSNINSILKNTTIVDSDAYCIVEKTNLKKVSYNLPAGENCIYVKSIINTASSNKILFKFNIEKVDWFSSNEMADYYTKSQIDNMINNLNNQLSNI